MMMTTNFGEYDSTKTTPYRAILILDTGLEHLYRPLRDKDFWPLALTSGLSESQLQVLLGQRVLVTRAPERFLRIAAESEAAVIDASGLDNDDIVSAIEGAWSALRLSGKFYFLLRLKPSVKWAIEPLE